MTYVEPDEGQIRQLGRAVRDKVWPLMDDAVGKQNMDVVRANATKLN